MSTKAWRCLWSAIAVALTVLDLRRERADVVAGRDYINGTTFSCFCRWLITRIPGGKLLFIGGLAAFAVWFLGHIINYLEAQIEA